MPSEHAQLPGHSTGTGEDPGAGQDRSDEAVGLDAVLAGTDDAQPRFAGLAAGAGRWLSFAGMLVAVGALVVVINHPGGIHR